VCALWQFDALHAVQLVDTTMRPKKR